MWLKLWQVPKEVFVMMVLVALLIHVFVIGFRIEGFSLGDLIGHYQQEFHHRAIFCACPGVRAGNIPRPWLPTESVQSNSVEPDIHFNMGALNKA